MSLGGLEKAYGDVGVLLCIETDYTKPVVISVAKADSCLWGIVLRVAYRTGIMNKEENRWDTLVKGFVRFWLEYLGNKVPWM